MPRPPRFSVELLTGKERWVMARRRARNIRGSTHRFVFEHSISVCISTLRNPFWPLRRCPFAGTPETHPQERPVGTRRHCRSSGIMAFTCTSARWSRFRHLYVLRRVATSGFAGRESFRARDGALLTIA